MANVTMKEFSMFEAPDSNLFSHKGVCALYSNLMCEEHKFCIFFDESGNIIPKEKLSDELDPWAVFVFDALPTKCLMMMLGYQITGIKDESKKVYSWNSEKQEWVLYMTKPGDENTCTAANPEADNSGAVDVSDTFNKIFNYLEESHGETQTSINMP